MLGNSAGVHREIGFVRGALLLSILVLSACPKIVSQDAHTGPDGKPKGAQKVTLENGEGKARGIVTYPGGDRVDWKQIDLPKDKPGTLTLKLSWQAPRPGEDLSFAVYDEYFWPIAEAKPKKKGNRTSKKVDPIEHARGTYYVMIYASNRGDAGKYTLNVSYEEEKAAPEFDLSTLQVPDPPKLAMVPAPAVPCDVKKFDDKNPDCANKCPDPPDMSKPACKNVCPAQQSADIPACQIVMPCGSPPDRRIKACMDQWARSKPAPWPDCDRSKPKDPANPNCDAKIKIAGRVVDVQATGGDVIITINRGSAQGVGEKWLGKLLSGGRPISGGDFTVIRVTKGQAIGKVKVQVDLAKNAGVELQEP